VFYQSYDFFKSSVTNYKSTVTYFKSSVTYFKSTVTYFKSTVTYYEKIGKKKGEVPKTLPFSSINMYANCLTGTSQLLAVHQLWLGFVVASYVVGLVINKSNVI